MEVLKPDHHMLLCRWLARHALTDLNPHILTTFNQVTWTFLPGSGPVEINLGTAPRPPLSHTPQTDQQRCLACGHVPVPLHTHPTAERGGELILLPFLPSRRSRHKVSGEVLK